MKPTLCETVSVLLLSGCATHRASDVADMPDVPYAGHYIDSFETVERYLGRMDTNAAALALYAYQHGEAGIVDSYHKAPIWSLNFPDFYGDDDVEVVYRPEYAGRKDDLLFIHIFDTHNFTGKVSLYNEGLTDASLSEAAVTRKRLPTDYLEIITLSPHMDRFRWGTDNTLYSLKDVPEGVQQYILEKYSTVLSDLRRTIDVLPSNNKL